MRPSSLLHPLADGIAEAILRSSAEAIAASDRDGRIVFWNPGAERVFGYAPEEAVGQSLDIIIPERLRARHWEGYRHVMRSGESRYAAGDTLAVPALRRDGSQISIEFTIAPLRGPAGELTGIAAVMRDVTARFEELKLLRRQARAAGPSPAA